MRSESHFLVLAADTFTPLSTSGAIQLHDLAASLSHTVDLLVIAPHQGVSDSFALGQESGFRILRVKTLPMKDVNYFRRVIGEFLMPFFMWRAIQRTPYRNRRCAGIIWYSPTIFLGPLVAKLKRLHGCRSYLILRDLFPDWAVDARVMRKGLAYRVLKWVESYQYRQADIIGVQTPANLLHLAPWDDGTRRIEVLPNWLAPAVSAPCSLDVSQTALVVRRIFVLEGLIIGLAGVLLGWLFGYALCLGLGLVEFKSGFTDATRLPLLYSPRHYAIAGGVALFASMLAGYLPARKAASVHPVDIIRGAS